MDHRDEALSDEALSAEDRYVFQKLDEAREQYETYLSIKAAADLATLRKLSDQARREVAESDVYFTPQPLTIIFDSSN